MYMRRMLTLLVLGTIAGLCPASSSHASPDSNRDGLIDVVDVQYVVGAILSSAGSSVTGADVDGDGVVDVADIQKVVNEILAVPRPLLAWSPTSDTQAWVGIPFSLQLQSSGGQSGHTWSLVSGSLPPGLILSAAGVVSGTPGSAGTVSFAVRVTDASSATHDRNITLMVGTPEPAAITSSAVTTGMKGVPYRYQVTASGQPAPTVSVTGLPAWLTYSSATGLISGMPGVPQIGTTGTVTITASNVLQPSATQSFSIAIAPQPVSKRTFDFNGDGYNDLVVGAPAVTTGTVGSAYIYFGRESLPIEINATQASVIIYGLAGTHFAHIVASAGDVNGDGFDDLLISEKIWNSNTGRVHLYFGSATPQAVYSVSQTPADVTIVGAGVNDALGQSVVAIGDFGGIGISSFAIGANGPPFDFSGGSTGRLYVFHGRSTWQSSYVASSADVVIDGDQAGAQFGAGLAYVGDFNGDGKADIFTGAHHFNETSAVSSGRGYLYFGRTGTGLSLAASQADVTFISNVADGIVGAGATGGFDVNGDGRSDIIIPRRRQPTQGPGESQAFIFFGSPNVGATRLLNSADVTVNSLPNTGTGNSLWAFGSADLNGDSMDDLAISSLVPSGGPYAQQSMVQVLLGRNQWPSQVSLSVGDILLVGSQSDPLLGIMALGDFRGTGRPCLFASFGLWTTAQVFNYDIGVFDIPLFPFPPMTPSSIQTRLTTYGSIAMNYGAVMETK